ncbi:MAG: site-2 protease family protein [Candidatus Nealsonbacteria bacterium]
MLITIFTLIVLLFSIVIHEITHGSVALSQGDPTAKYAGRLTLNPLKHIDLFGTIILPLLIVFTYMGLGVMGPVIGWAKPVPVNPNNFRDRRWGELKVSIAGPAINFLIAIIFGLALRFFQLPEIMIELFSIICIYNFLWGLFNLLPIPPLDGSHILFSFLPFGFTKLKLQLQQYGFFIIIIFVFLLGGLRVLFGLAYFFFSLVTGI